MSDVVAFDIDGVLTTDEGIKLYRELKSDPSVSVHVVTARNKTMARDFVFQNDLEPDSLHHTQLKGQALSNISDSGTYYGSWARDRVHARVAGWDYEQI